MIEVTNKDDLKKALVKNDEDQIHISNKQLTLDLLTRPQRYRRIFYAMRANHYRLIRLKSCGTLDLSFIRSENG